MKQLLILDRQFNVKKLGLVNTSPTIFDTISPQKTTLELLKDESVDIGNIISIKQYETQEFLGIVQDISVKNKTELYIYPFINAFNCECSMESINGYVYDWIVATMEANFVNIVDDSLKLNLEFRNMMTLQPSLSYIFSDGNLFEALKKIFYITGVYLEFSLKFVNGIATAIYCDIYNTNDYPLITVRYDNPLLGEEKPVIENSMNYGTNKIILKPEEGASGNTYAFYLLEDNTVTTNQGASGRLTPVNQKIARYAEGTSSEELQLIAEKELLGEAYDHNIYFKIIKNDSYQFALYRKVKFITEDRTYVSYCSKIDKTQDNVLGITLGVIRNNLTDKVKELEAQTSSLSSATSAGSGAIIPVLNWGNIGGSINNQADLRNALAGKIPTTEKGAVNGVATLGADGKLTSTQMPAIRVTDVYVVASQAEMLALEADEGDVAKRTDLGKSFILSNDLPSILSSWLPMTDDYEPIGAVSTHNSSETAHSTLFGGKVDKVAGKGLSTNDLTDELKTAYDGAVTDKHTHSNKATLDTYTQTEANLADAVSKKHTHSNKATLDTYTQTETDLASAVSLKHTHSNKAVLDNTTASYTTEEATKLSGIDANAEVNVIETVKVNGTALTPSAKAVDVTVPTKTSQLTNDSGFIDNSNAMDLTTSQTANGAKTFGDNLTLSKKLFVGTMQTIYNASEESSNFLGSLFFGDGGGLLSHITSIEGYGDTGIGINSLYNNTTGYENTGVGLFSLYNNTTGYYNTGIGSRAGHTIANGTTGNMTPSNSVYIGAYTKALADNQTNQIVIGYDTTGHGSNTVTIGNTSITDNYFNGNLHLTGALKNATNTFTLPSSTGTLALTSDIPSVSDFLVASNIKAGTNITLSVSGKDVTINSTGGATVTVVDNLTSTSTTSALSANQGKVLNDNKVPNTRTVAGKALSANITLASTDLTDTANIATVSQLATKAVQPYIQRSYSGGNGVRLIGIYNYSTSVGDTRPLFYMAGKQGHGNGTSYLWQGEFIFGVSTTGVVTAKAILKVSDGTFGKFYYRHDTTNKILYLYIYTGQYSSAYFSDLIQINAGDYSSYFTLSPAGSVTTDTIIEGVNILYPASGGTIALTSQIPSTSNFVDLTTAQTIAGTKTFSDDLKLSKKLFVGTMQTIYNADAEGGFTGSLFFGNGGASLSHTTFRDGYYNTGIGIDSLHSNTTGSHNTAVGYSALHSNITGSHNIAVGYNALYYDTGNNSIAIGNMSFYSKTTGISNIAIGFYAGNYISDGTTPNTIITDSIFIGGMSSSLADNQRNQIVIGNSAIGHGTNTVTIGNSSITDNYFNGNLHLTGTIKNATSTFTLPTATGTLATLLDVYPIGAIYISVVSTSPASLFGGTWVAFGAGRVLLGMGSNGETNYTTIKATGGSENSYSSHNHGNVSTTNGYFDIGSFGTSAETLINVGGFVTRSSPANGTNNFWSIDKGSRPLRRATLNHSHSVASTGTTGGNRMPYITVYMWERTA